MPNQTPLNDPLAAERATNGRRAAGLLRVAVDLHRLTTPPYAASREELIAELAEVARTAEAALTGKPATMSYEYMVLWHGDGDGNATRMSESQISHLSQALRTGPARIGQYGITHFTIQYRTHVAFSDDSSWTSGWEPVDHRGTVFPCPICQTTVFRAGLRDIGPALLAATPDPNGELVLIPAEEHGGEPGAIYGEPTWPGKPRYRMHGNTCATATTDEEGGPSDD